MHTVEGLEVKKRNGKYVLVRLMGGGGDAAGPAVSVTSTDWEKKLLGHFTLTFSSAVACASRPPPLPRSPLSVCAE